MSRLSASRVPPKLSPRWRGRVSEYVLAGDWSPDGKSVAVIAADGAACVFDAATGAVKHTIAAHTGGGMALSWGPGGRFATAGQDGFARVWDAESGAKVADLPGGAAWVERVAWSRRLDRVATAAGKLVKIWDADGTLVRECPGHGGTVAALAWKPGEPVLAVGAYGGVWLWPADAGEARHLAWKGSPLCLGWSPDGRFVAHGNQDSTVHFWFADAGEELQMYGYPLKVAALAWDASAKLLATAGSSAVTVWDCSGAGPEGREPLTLTAHDEAATVGPIAFQHAGPLLVEGADDTRVHLWQPGGRKRTPLAITRLEAPASVLAWSGDDRRVLAASEGGEVVVFDT